MQEEDCVALHNKQSQESPNQWLHQGSVRVTCHPLGYRLQNAPDSYTQRHLDFENAINLISVSHFSLLC